MYFYLLYLIFSHDNIIFNLLLSISKCQSNTQTQFIKPVYYTRNEINSLPLLVHILQEQEVSLLKGQLASFFCGHCLIEIFAKQNYTNFLYQNLFDKTLC